MGPRHGKSLLPSKGPVQASPEDSSAQTILHTDVVLSPTTSTLGKCMTLRFDTRGGSTYEEVTRNDVLTTIRIAATSVAFSANKPDGARSAVNMMASSPQRRSKPHSRIRQQVDTAMDIPTVHMRDIRKLDKMFSTSNEPSITVRQQAILVNCDPVRAVIMRDCCLVFLPDGADSLIAHLKANFKLHIADATAFEFAALEAILATVCFTFSTQCKQVIPEGRAALEKMTKDESIGELESLRSIKNTMSVLESQLGGMRRLLMNLLENEADLHMMYLTKLCEDPKLAQDLYSFDTEDVESILELYLQEIYGSQTRVALMAHNIVNTESIVMLKLDSKRNFLLSVDLSLTVLGTLIAMPTFIVGAFGMNLNSHIQDTEYIFWIVFALCGLFIVVGYVVVARYLKDQGINMSWTY
ncbi:hypothetical protein, variant 1 [Aphanomyces invadans]|uniref:Magnesium transporter n=1 Tax=Aphanomyces invadans TaxID=157072 RepID=A0A024UI11_9STRA|nr:hypothetical protein, variant 1 [Aphanomyces invadans]ETW05840.1 hypothetical protein, variant 1 [Aphanomyces invadans]|eukprot:XP_008865617.1 hypothetical protein, variant 1 [Aphanomyces invadans]